MIEREVAEKAYTQAVLAEQAASDALTHAREVRVAATAKVEETFAVLAALPDPRDEGESVLFSGVALTALRRVLLFCSEKRVGYGGWWTSDADALRIVMQVLPQHTKDTTP